MEERPQALDGLVLGGSKPLQTTCQIIRNLDHHGCYCLNVRLWAHGVNVKSGIAWLIWHGDVQYFWQEFRAVEKELLTARLDSSAKAIYRSRMKRVFDLPYCWRLGKTLCHSHHKQQAWRCPQWAGRLRDEQRKSVVWLKYGRMSLTLLESLSPLWLALLGWFLGLLTPGIATYIRDRHRSKQLISALIQEFVTFRYQMTTVSFRLHSHLGFLSDEYLDRIILLVEGYRGADGSEKIRFALKTLRDSPLDARTQAAVKESEGLSIPEYSLPLFISHASELAICPLKFQWMTLRVRRHVDLFNQSVPVSRYWLHKTFDKLSEPDRQAVNTNLRGAYDNLRLQSEQIIRAIGELNAAYPLNHKQVPDKL